MDARVEGYDLDGHVGQCAGFNQVVELTLHGTPMLSVRAAARLRPEGIPVQAVLPRLDLLLSPHAADRLVGVAVHKETRGWDKPSDHVPVSIELDV